MERLVLDTNVLVRLFRPTDDQHPEVARLFLDAEDGGLKLILPDTVVMETTFVLEGTYQVERAEITRLLSTVLRHGAVDCPGGDILVDALRRYAATRLDFADCHVAAWAAALDAPACSLDKDLRRFADIKVRKPGAN